jgi:hypothetical protein
MHLVIPAKSISEIGELPKYRFRLPKPCIMDLTVGIVPNRLLHAPVKRKIPSGDVDLSFVCVDVRNIRVFLQQLRARVRIS